MEAFDRDNSGDGDNLLRLTTNPNEVTEYNPAWRPDGRLISYSSIGSGCETLFPYLNIGIYQANAYSRIDGCNTEANILVDDVGDATSHSWSPDGQMIAYTSNQRGPQQINLQHVNRIQLGLISLQDHDTNPETASEYTAVPDTEAGAQINLTFGPGNRLGLAANQHSPSWSPDGTRLAFTSNIIDFGFTTRVHILQFEPFSYSTSPIEVKLKNYWDWDSEGAVRTAHGFWVRSSPHWSHALVCQAYLQGADQFFGNNVVDSSYRTSDPVATKPCLEIYESLIFWSIYNETSSNAFQIPDYLKAALPPQLAQDSLFGDVYLSARVAINAVLDVEVRPEDAGRGDPINYFTENYKGSIGNIFVEDPLNNDELIGNAQQPQWHVNNPTLVVPLWPVTCGGPHPSVAIRQQLQGATLPENSSAYYVLNTIEHVRWFDDQIECFMDGGNGDVFYQVYMDIMPIIHAALHDHLYNTRIDPTNGAYSVRGANIEYLCTEYHRQSRACLNLVELNLVMITTVGEITTVNQVTGGISEAVCTIANGDNELKAYERQLDLFYYQGETPNNRRETPWYIATDGPSIHVHVFRSGGGEWVTRSYQQPSHRSYPANDPVRRFGGFITRLVGADLGSIEFQSLAYGTQRNCG